MPLSSFHNQNPKQLLIFSEDVSFGPPLNLHTCDSLQSGVLVRRVRALKILANLIFNFLFTAYPRAFTAFPASESDIMLNGFFQTCQFWRSFKYLKVFFTRKIVLNS